MFWSCIKKKLTEQLASGQCIRKCLRLALWCGLCKDKEVEKEKYSEFGQNQLITHLQRRVTVKFVTRDCPKDLLIRLWYSVVFTAKLVIFFHGMALFGHVTSECMDVTEPTWITHWANMMEFLFCNFMTATAARSKILQRKNLSIQYSTTRCKQNGSNGFLWIWLFYNFFSIAQYICMEKRSRQKKHIFDAISMP